MAARNRQRKGKRYFLDLRDFIAQLEQTGNLHRITDRIEKNSELMPLVRWQYQGLPDGQRKAFLFDNVTDPKGKSYDCRVAVGVLGASRAIYKLALGLNEKSEAGEVAERWNQALSHPVKPRLVKSGPVKEVILTHRWWFAPLPSADQQPWIRRRTFSYGALRRDEGFRHRRSECRYLPLHD
jgi:3-polyprenyl-4-hydroxybenzoate decarboxylase